MPKTLPAFAALISLLTLAGCGGQSAQSPAPAPAKPPGASAPAKAKPELKTELVNCPAPGAGLDSQVKLDGTTYAALKTGDLAVAVTKVQTASELGKHKAQGRYVILTLGLQNQGMERSFAGLMSDHVIISEGKRYSADAFAGIAYRDAMDETNLDFLNPDLSGVVTWAYDLPESHDPCKAQVEITRRPERKPKEVYLLPIGIAKQ